MVGLWFYIYLAAPVGSQKYVATKLPDRLQCQMVLVIGATGASCVSTYWPANVLTILDNLVAI